MFTEMYVVFHCLSLPILLTLGVDLAPKTFRPRVHTKLVRYSTDMHVPTSGHLYYSGFVSTCGP